MIASSERPAAAATPGLKASKEGGCCTLRLLNSRYKVMMQGRDRGVAWLGKTSACPAAAGWS